MINKMTITNKLLIIDDKCLICNKPLDECLGHDEITKEEAEKAINIIIKQWPKQQDLGTVNDPKQNER